MPTYYFPAGSGMAEALIKSAKFRFPDDGPEHIKRIINDSSSHHIAPSFWGNLDVLAIKNNENSSEREVVKEVNADPNKKWNKNYLVNELGFDFIERPTVVVDRETNEILLLYLDVNDDTRNRENAVSFAMDMKSTYPMFKGARPSTSPDGPPSMTGMRYSTMAWKSNTALGLYTPGRGETDEFKQRKADFYGGISNMEKNVSPFVNDVRYRMCKATGANGDCSAICPDRMTLNQCPATSAGCSRGYVSLLHRDKGYIETILFLSPAKNTPIPSWCFAIVKGNARICVSLESGNKMIMVPSWIWHGTPHVSQKTHGGMGFVICNKSNFFSPKVFPHVKDLWRLMEKCGMEPMTQKQREQSDTRAFYAIQSRLQGSSKKLSTTIASKNQDRNNEWIFGSDDDETDEPEIDMSASGSDEESVDEISTEECTEDSTDECADESADQVSTEESTDEMTDDKDSDYIPSSDSSQKINYISSDEDEEFEIERYQKKHNKAQDVFAQNRQNLLQKKLKGKVPKELAKDWKVVRTNATYNNKKGSYIYTHPHPLLERQSFTSVRQSKEYVLELVKRCK